MIASSEDRTFPIFQMSVIFRYQRMRTISISAKTIQSTERSFISFRIRKWKPLCGRCFLLLLSEPADITKIRDYVRRRAKEISDRQCDNRHYTKRPDL